MTHQDAYNKLNRIARVSRCSKMSTADYRLFVWIIDHAQQIVRLEAELQGVEIA